MSQQDSFSSYANKPTILQIIPSLKSGGVEIEAIEIGKAIINKGGKAILAAQLLPVEIDERAKSIELINLPLDKKNPFQIYKNYQSLKKIITQKKVDIVHVRSRAPAWSAYLAARSLNVPFVTTYHAAYKSKTIFKTLYNSIMAKGDRVIAISRFIQNHLFECYARYPWFNSNKIRLIERGIDLDYFNSSRISTEQALALRKIWGFSDDMRILLLPGRISKMKGHDLLIKALSLLHSKNTAVILLGSDDGHEAYRERLLQYAASLGLEERVKWFPSTTDMALAYKAADLVVSPSKLPEGFGRTMAEAQAMEKPIISSNHGASHEIIEDGITGWLTPPRNAIALAKVIDLALSQSDKSLAHMGKKGRERVRQLFSYESMAIKTINVYKELLPESNTP